MQPDLQTKVAGSSHPQGMNIPCIPKVFAHTHIIVRTWGAPAMYEGESLRARFALSNFLFPMLELIQGTEGCPKLASIVPAWQTICRGWKDNR